MNAVVGLCHFCEAHGPRAIFCTFTTEDESNTTEPSSTSPQCTGCTSLGSETVFVSREAVGTIYCSRESVPNSDVTAFLKQAAVRSITCEVNWSKEGGVVYFSDTQGHVLSYTFQLRDTRSRGLKRWFSIVVLMKDKMLLLNIMPGLSEHMEKISKELQGLAEVVFNDEQQVCSQRALRLNTGRNDFGQSRSLKQLTGDEDVFKKLHMHFTWMLKAGALTFSENLYTSHNLLWNLSPISTKGSIFQQEACFVPSADECLPLRRLENVLGQDVFKIALYCVLTGIPIVMKSISIDVSTIKKALERLQPIKSTHSNIIIANEVIHINSNSCYIEETKIANFTCKWSGSVPAKSPTAMNRILSAMTNLKFNDDVLHQHIKSLLLEWLGIAKALKSAIDSSGAKSDGINKLKKVLCITAHDEGLVNYWISSYCT